jgi:Bifunctional DNA primase/polymerase, N-terminal
MNDVPQRDSEGDVLVEVDLERPAALVPGREDDGAALVLDRRGANLAAALRLVRAGMPVFPVRLFQGSSGGWNKIPHIKDWQRAASTDAAQIDSWWNEFPDAVPAVALGRCGLVVVDPDRHQGGADGVTAFADLVRRRGGLPPHPVTETAGGGEHHVFHQRDGEPLGNRTGGLPDGICVRGYGGFVVAPGAVRPDGAAWRADSHAPDLADAFRNKTIPIIPEWLVELIRRDVSTANGDTGASATGDRERK